MDYNLGLLSDPEELRRLLAAAQVQPEDRSGANMQALLAFGAALMGAKKGQEFDALSRGALGGLVARNNALETAREGRSRTLVNAGMGQEILARGRKMKQEDEDRATAMADRQEFNRLFAGNAPDVAPMANGKGPTVENAAAQAPAPNEVRQYRAMAQYYAMRRNGDMAKKMNDIADSLEEKYSQTPQAVRLPDGRIAYAQFGNRGGRKVAEGVSPAEKLYFANTGDKAAVGFDPYSGAQVSGGAKINMSDTERDASARGWASNALAREQFGWNKQKDLADLSMKKDEYNFKVSDRAEKERTTREGVDTRADIVLNTAKEALDKVGPFTTGVIGAGWGSVPGTEAYDLRRAAETIKANLGFQALQDMRAQSPTGGALGQVAVQELQMLQATVANLDPNQAPGTVAANIQKVITHIENWKRAAGQKSNVRSEADRILQGQ